MPARAVIMNMYHTGLGIARSLGERGVDVIGLTSNRTAFGNFTRYAQTVYCPDSREQPEELRSFLLKIGRELGDRAVLFPTRDDDLLFLDRFRNELEAQFSLVLPESSVLKGCLNKWDTYLWSKRVGIAVPNCWLVKHKEEFRSVFPEVTYPCVLKPISSHHWRQGINWKLVGGRKAIGIYSKQELLKTYETIAAADERALIQEMIIGADSCLITTACYLDCESRWVAGFNAQKRIQFPEAFGIGCIVQAVNRSELFEPTVRLLEAMKFTGIAEVEYKWDAQSAQYKLIEVNPRPWNQHRLGAACGVDLIYIAYCEHAGLAMRPIRHSLLGQKWIAEDSFISATLHLLTHRNAQVRPLLHEARGKLTYCIWSLADPLPMIACVIAQVVPAMLKSAARVIWSAVKRSVLPAQLPRQKGRIYARKTTASH